MIRDRKHACLLAAMVLLLVAPAVGLADQYWVAYEGNDYPENEGWWRIWYDIPAERSLEEGALVLDTRADIMIAEYYEWPPVGDLDPDPGETFVLQWRIRIDEVTSTYEPHVSVVSDDEREVFLRLSEDAIFDADGNEAAFAPGVFHEFEFRSYDMLYYQVYIDGAAALEGSFHPCGIWPRVTWGAAVQGASSLARWDYVRFGVVPEPHSATLFVVVWFLATTGRRAHTRGGFHGTNSPILTRGRPIGGRKVQGHLR